MSLECGRRENMHTPFKRASGLGIEPITLLLNDMFLIVLIVLSCFLHLLNQTQQLVDFAHMDSDTYLICLSVVYFFY